MSTEEIAQITYSTLAATGIDNPYWDVLMNEVPHDDTFSHYRGIHAYVPSAYGMLFGKDENGETTVERRFPDRNTLVRLYSWAIPSPQAVEWMAGLLGAMPVVEVGAGTGYWAWQLAQHGVSVTAFDQLPPDTHENWFHSEIETIDSEITQEDLHEWRERYAPLFEIEDIAKVDPLWPRPKPPELGSPTQRQRVKPGSTREIFHQVLVGGPEEVAKYADHALFLCWPPYDKPLAHDALRAYQGDHLFFCGEGDGGCTGDEAFFRLLEDEWERLEFCDSHVSYSGINDELTYYTRKK